MLHAEKLELVHVHCTCNIEKLGMGLGTNKAMIEKKIFFMSSDILIGKGGN